MSNEQSTSAVRSAVKAAAGTAEREIQIIDGARQIHSTILVMSAFLDAPNRGIDERDRANALYDMVAVALKQAAAHRAICQ